MVKRKSAQVWKAITFEDTSLNSQGLVAFEECTDYDITKFTNRGPQGLKRKNNDVNKKPIKNKGKLSKTNEFIKSEDDTSEKTQEIDEDAIIVKKPMKKKRKLCKTSTKTENSRSDKKQKIDVSMEVIEGFEVWSQFGLTNSIIKALSVQGFNEPTLIQSLTLPAAILGSRDIVGAAETGSGKTLAFCLPILSGILKEKSQTPDNDAVKPLYALILTPTRELAMQIKNHIEAVTKFIDVNVAVIVGGMAAVKQERILSKGPEIVVATPGRLWELIQQGNSHLAQIGDIKYLAIDETDRMLEKGHFEELHNLLERINIDKAKIEKRQNFVFSATLTLVHELPKYLMKKTKASKMNSEQKLQKIISILGITNPKIVDITGGGNTPKALVESRICCSLDEKDYYVYYFLQKHPGRTIIFCNSIGCVKRLSNLLKILDLPVLPIHASMQQRQRLKNLERFRDDGYGVLVATDVAARGLDIPNIEHVLHYQTPRTSESYIHRSGRTARATKQGIAVLLCEPGEMQNYMKLCKALHRTENLPTFPIQDDFLQTVKKRVNLARQLDKLELSLQKTNAAEGWLQKAAKEMDIIVDDLSEKYDRSSNNAAQKKLANVKRKQLSALLAKPIFPKGFSGNYPQFSAESGQEESAIEVLKNVVQKPTKIHKRKSNK